MNIYKERKQMKIKYRVKLFNDFTEPYWMSDNPETSPIVKHRCIDEYICDDDKVFKQVIDDFLDAPKKKLTEKDIRHDFDENRGHMLSDNKVKAIQIYYNGRLSLKKKVYADLAKIKASRMKAGSPVVLKYSIPFEMNYFSCNDNDPCDKLTKMNDSYIEIEVLKNKEDKDDVQ